jgi:hypothetical protein
MKRCTDWRQDALILSQRNPRQRRAGPVLTGGATTSGGLLGSLLRQRAAGEGLRQAGLIPGVDGDIKPLGGQAADLRARVGGAALKPAIAVAARATIVRNMMVLLCSDVRAMESKDELRVRPIAENTAS